MDFGQFPLTVYTINVPVKNFGKVFLNKKNFDGVNGVALQWPGPSIAQWDSINNKKMSDVSQSMVSGKVGIT